MRIVISYFRIIISLTLGVDDRLVGTVTKDTLMTGNCQQSNDCADAVAGAGSGLCGLEAAVIDGVQIQGAGNVGADVSVSCEAQVVAAGLAEAVDSQIAAGSGILQTPAVLVSDDLPNASLGSISGHVDLVAGALVVQVLAGSNVLDLEAFAGSDELPDLGSILSGNQTLIVGQANAVQTVAAVAFAAQIGVGVAVVGCQTGVTAQDVEAFLDVGGLGDGVLAELSGSGVLVAALALDAGELVVSSGGLVAALALGPVLLVVVSGLHLVLDIGGLVATVTSGPVVVLVVLAVQNVGLLVLLLVAAVLFGAMFSPGLREGKYKKNVNKM